MRSPRDDDGVAILQIVGLMPEERCRLLGNMLDGPIPGRDGQFVMAIDVSAFEDVSRFEHGSGEHVMGIEDAALLD